MPTTSRKPVAPPVLDYPAPGTIPAGSGAHHSAAPPAPSLRPASGAPVLDYLPPGAASAAPASGRTAQLAARVDDLLLAQGLSLPRLAPPGHSAIRDPRSAFGSSAFRHPTSIRLPGARRFWWAYLCAGLGLVALLLRLGTALAGALADPLTTAQYGEVRTTHLRVFFGLPGETSTSPSLLTATNDAGTGHVWLLPAGQAAQASVLEIPLT